LISLESACEGQSRGQLVRDGGWLEFRFQQPQDVLSWAVLGGGRRRAQRVIWCQVNDDDLKPPVKPVDFIRDQALLRGQSPAATVGFLTSADISGYADMTLDFGGLQGRAVATAGMGNARRAGDACGPSGRIGPAPVGTINLLVSLSCVLSESAFIEAMSIAAEGRTLAVLENKILSPVSQKLATGTGTDCICVSAQSAGSKGRKYAGKHTDVGYLVGQLSYQVVHKAVANWKSRVVYEG